MYRKKLTGLLSKRIPTFTRVLLIESGSRQLFEDLLDGLYEVHPEMTADLVTCYAGTPQKFRPERGRVFRVGEYRDAAGRKGLYRELRGAGYTAVGMICSAEPIMTKWKWVLALQVPAKAFILNENGDYFWLDRGHASNVFHFALFRAGLTGAGAARTLARLAAFPFVVLYLLLFAATVHLQRRLRTL